MVILKVHNRTMASKSCNINYDVTFPFTTGYKRSYSETFVHRNGNHMELQITLSKMLVHIQEFFFERFDPLNHSPLEVT